MIETGGKLLMNFTIIQSTSENRSKFQNIQNTPRNSEKKTLKTIETYSTSSKMHLFISQSTVKVDREKQLVCVDELLDEISVDELQEQLPGHQPRYIVYSYKMIHDDNRISYPMCFIFYTPRDSQMELQIMYAGTKRALQREADLTRVYEIRELDELTEEWLKEKLAR